MKQMTLDGREIDHATVVRAQAPLSCAQHEILRWLRDHRGTINAARAGRIVHANRNHPCQAPRHPEEPCCRWSTADGKEAMKRLVDRGYVKRVADGLWMTTGGAGDE